MTGLEFDIEETLEKLSMAEKVKLLTGFGFWHTQLIPGAGIEPMRMSDGPNGVRGTQVFNGVPSSCYPCATGIASSFDIELAHEIGLALADECIAKSVHILLAPTVNTQRSPLGGRGFESFSEDAHLSGTMAAAYICGVQSKGVACTLKHYVANEQEYQRNSVSSEVHERALREIYLKPFQIVIRESDPWAIMAALNRVNGVHASENVYLLEDILRKEWDWKGMIMSDWTGLYSTSEGIIAGLDLDMPGPTPVRGAAVERALQGEKLFPEHIDARVRKILKLYKHALASGIPFNGPENGVDTPHLRALLRRAAADSVVLLKNEHGLLPLQAHKLHTIAVIGPNAKRAFASGGGSADLTKSWVVSPLEGIVTAVGADVEVKYAVGTLTYRYLPPLDGSMQHGATIAFWNAEPAKGWIEGENEVAKPVWSTQTQTSYCPLLDGVNDEKVAEKCWYRYSTIFIPDESGDHEFELIIGGLGALFIDGELTIDLFSNSVDSAPMFGPGTVGGKATVTGLGAGKPVYIEARVSNAAFIDAGQGFETRGGIRLGAGRVMSGDEAIAAAVKLAKHADVAIVVMGLNSEWESEGSDRADMKLPGLTDNLVVEVLKANRHTVIVNQSGTQVEMPWVHHAHTLLQAFYGGNELGNGLADVLFGKVNPSAKLSLTFPKRLEDTPSFPSFGDQSEVYGKVYYTEGIYAGYRGYDKKRITPLFSFGHGLSYTTFEYHGLSVTRPSHSGHFTVYFSVENTGEKEGREVAQVYIADPVSTLPRPIKELKGFSKVHLKAGETKKVTLELDREALSYYDQMHKAWVAEKGAFEVWVGASAADIRLKRSFELEQSLIWRGL